MRLVIGDALHSLGDLGSGGLRLDANGFLGVEKTGEGAPAWSEGHPLSEAANQFISSMVRKVGGFTFQELNLTMDDILQGSARGADLSYDFVNRPAYHHAMATGDTEFLRLTLNLGAELGVEPVSLVHALQNHDEMTYELVHFATLHAADTFSYHGAEISGGELAVRIRQDLLDHLTGESGPYNATFTQNGIASTTATIIAASLGFTDLTALTDEQVELIKDAHLLLAMFNALQPGVFALSGWDLVGALTLDRSQIKALLADGDTRWIHRAAYDLMDYRPNATESTSQMPRGKNLYGVTARAARAGELVRPAAARHSRGPQTVRHRERDPARRATGLAPLDAGDGPSARRGGAGDGAELLGQRDHRYGPLRGAGARQRAGGHDDRCRAGRGRRPAKLRPDPRSVRGPVAAGDVSR